MTTPDRIYEDDDHMLARVMREAMPQFRRSPALKGYTAPDNSPEAKAARVAGWPTSPP
jgi:hypothetical protein